jgi:hypothetical protein
MTTHVGVISASKHWTARLVQLSIRSRSQQSLFSASDRPKPSIAKEPGVRFVQLYHAEPGRVEIRVTP